VREEMHRCVADGERPEARARAMNGTDIEREPNHGNVGAGEIAGSRDAHEGVGTARRHTEGGGMLPVGGHEAAAGHGAIVALAVPTVKGPLPGALRATMRVDEETARYAKVALDRMLAVA
jgi:hypothetical protein